MREFYADSYAAGADRTLSSPRKEQAVEGRLVCANKVVAGASSGSLERRIRSQDPDQCAAAYLFH